MTLKLIKMENKANKKEWLKTQLIELSPNINSAHRMKMALDLGISFITVNRYFNGEIGNVVRAERILREVKKIAA